MALRCLWDGSVYEVLAYARSEASCEIVAYLDGLSERDQKRVRALLEYSSEHEPPRNREKCRKIAGEPFWEFKAHQQRVFWCYDPTTRKRIILLHGFTKKTRQLPKREIEAGRRAYREVQQELDIANYGRTK